jgi:voltage-gated sodium channel
MTAIRTGLSRVASARARLGYFMESPRVTMAITAIIVVNAITLGLETSTYITAHIGGLLDWLDRLVLGIFVVEMVLKISAFGWRYFTKGWNIFDFIIVAIALMPATGALSVLRSLRILRVLRLVALVPAMRKVVQALLAAIPGVSSVIALLALVYYVFAVMTTKLFGGTFPQWFGTVGDSMYTLFQIMTLESWSMGIVRPVMREFPYAWAFFVPFIIVTTFAVLNLFIGIVVNAMQAEHEKAAAEERDMIHDETEHLAEEIRALRTEIAALRDRIERPVDQPAE